MIRAKYNVSGTGGIGGIGCGMFVTIAFINVVLGGMSVDYILSWFGKNMPFLADAVIGLFVAELSIPVAVVGYVLRAFGVF